MLADGKLDSLDTRLEQFTLNNASSQNELQSLLRDYAQLIGDYKILKRAVQEKKETVAVGSRNDNVVADKPRNPYLLVLVDGNGYIFNDELVRDKEEGGMRAARMLFEAVERYIRENLPQLKDVRVIVRVYADLTNLSKQLAKSKLTGLEKRSLAPFAAGFTRAIDLFDFVDALDEEGTKFKLRESFKLAVEDRSCSHILYAACHDTSYHSQLIAYSGARDKITLVQGAGFNSEFHQLGLNVTQFPTIFRWSELYSVTPTKATTTTTSDRNITPAKSKVPLKSYFAIQNESSWRKNGDTTFGAEDTSHADVNGSSEAAGDAWTVKTSDKGISETRCKYFQKGFCRFGNKCKFQHAPGNMLTPDAAHTPPTHSRSNLSLILPTHPVPGFIPLNKDGHRLDTVIPPPTQEAWVIYNARFHRQKPCNDHFLQGICTKVACPYDHSPLEPQAQYCLEYVVKCSPCPRKGACRSASCVYGHICQKDDCVGQMKGCRMKGEMHSVDPVLASMVPVEQEDLLLDEVARHETGNMVASW